MSAGNFKSFRDMIDGGGAGATGKAFEGGGGLSDIANMIATPLGSQQPMRPQARPATMSTQGNAAPTPMAQPQQQQQQQPRPQARPAGLLDHGMPQMPQAPLPTVTPHYPQMRTSAPGYPQETASPQMPQAGVYAPTPSRSPSMGFPRSELEMLNDDELMSLARAQGVVK